MPSPPDKSSDKSSGKPPERPLLRQLYDSAERRIAPPLEHVVRTEQYADLAAALGRVQGLVTGAVRGATTTLWHLLNLPAGTDVQRLRRQIGALDREVRRLSLQLSLQETPRPSRKVDEDADPARAVEHPGPRAPRGGAQHTPGT